MAITQLRATFEGRRVTFTGRLASMSRVVACRCIVELGGRVSPLVTRKTDLVVVGSDGWPLCSSGKLTRALVRADELQQSCPNLEVVAEAEFVRRLGHGAQDGVRRLHSLEQLSRMLGVSGLRLRRWVRDGLIEPVAKEGSLFMFDFTEVAAARTLAHFLRTRPSVSQAAQSLERLRRWLPDDLRLAQHLHRLQNALAVRDGDGRIVDSLGQYHFSFEAPCERESDAESDAISDARIGAWQRGSAQPSSGLELSSISSSLLIREASPAVVESDNTSDFRAERLFNRAFALQEAGDTLAAIKLYRQWLRRYGPDAAVYFNLGNAWAELAEYRLAAATLRKCVRIDSSHSRGWNNLGLALAQLGEREAAINTLRRAIAEDEDYADACYNLADLLDEYGYAGEARLTWMRYLAHKKRGAMTVHARERLHDLSLSSIQSTDAAANSVGEAGGDVSQRDDQKTVASEVCVAEQSKTSLPLG